VLDRAIRGVIVGFRLHEPGRLPALSTRAAAVPTGLLAGALTTTVGINGPPLVIWLRARCTDHEQLRDTLALIFLTLNLAAIPTVTAHDAAIPTRLLPALAAGLIIGHTLGLQAHERLTTRTLDHILVAILIAAAGASIVASGAAWL
jgi:hypothetical protein